MRYTHLLFLATLALTACEPDAGNAQALDERDTAATAEGEAPTPPRPLVTPDAKVTIIEPTSSTPANTNAPALLVNGQPANPLCFASYLMGDGNEKTISLKPATCTAEITAINKDEPPIEGYIGTDFYWNSDPDAQGMRQSFIAYRMLGEDNGKVALELIGSGGGTGVFSTILMAERQGDSLTVTDSIAGGDRCNGGITEASLKNGKLNYAVNITPYDFLTLGTDTPPAGIEAYDDMDACAACCMGEALYEGKTFVGVRLPEKFVATERPAEQTVQICFDEIMSKQTKTEWSAADYAPLRDRIRGECKHD